MRCQQLIWVVWSRKWCVSTLEVKKSQDQLHLAVTCTLSNSAQNRGKHVKREDEDKISWSQKTAWTRFWDHVLAAVRAATTPQQLHFALCKSASETTSSAVSFNYESRRKDALVLQAQGVCASLNRRRLCVNDWRSWSCRWWSCGSSHEVSSNISWCLSREITYTRYTTTTTSLLGVWPSSPIVYEIRLGNNGIVIRHGSGKMGGPHRGLRPRKKRKRRFPQWWCMFFDSQKHKCNQDSLRPCGARTLPREHIEALSRLPLPHESTKMTVPQGSWICPRNESCLSCFTAEWWVGETGVGWKHRTGTIKVCATAKSSRELPTGISHLGCPSQFAMSGYTPSERFDLNRKPGIYLLQVLGIAHTCAQIPIYTTSACLTESRNRDCSWHGHV